MKKYALNTPLFIQLDNSIKKSAFEGTLKLKV